MAAVPGAAGEQAVALRLSGDKAMLYQCNILGTQDTQFDHQGRHYFYCCHIQGSIDFIFGNAKSLYQVPELGDYCWYQKWVLSLESLVWTSLSGPYQQCTLHAVARSYGAVAASQRNSPTEDTGFSFLHCRITGSGQIYLGRAWGQYSRVVYAHCRIDGIIVPVGWSDWNDVSRRSTAYFGEYQCIGAGAKLESNVNWGRSLTSDEAKPFITLDYVDGNQWLML